MMLKTWRNPATLTCALAVLSVGCSGNDDDASPTPSTSPTPAPATDAPATDAPATDAPATPTPATPTVTDSLYDRLGGEAGITAVIDDFLPRVLGDAKINGYFLNSSVDAANLSDCLVKFMGATTGGPQTYPDPEAGCRDMKTAHAGMGISSVEYNDLAGHLVASLNAFDVAEADVNAVVAALTDPGLVADIEEDPDNNATIYQRVGRKPAIDTVIQDFVGVLGPMCTDIVADPSSCP